MSDKEALVTGEDTSDSGEFLTKRLPPWMPADEANGNFKLIDAVGRGFDRLDGDIDTVDKESSIQYAQSKETIHELSKLMDESPRDDETLEEYRMRVIASFQKVTSEGTFEDLFGNIATLLDMDIRRVGYKDLDVNGETQISVPGKAVESVALTKNQLAEVIKDQTAAGYLTKVKSRGTFTYITPLDYNDGNHDVAKAYDGLDSNGDPKDNGGTYAGFLG